MLGAWGPGEAGTLGAAALNTGVHFPSRSQEEMISWMQVSERSQPQEDDPGLPRPTGREGCVGASVCACVHACAHLLPALPQELLCGSLESALGSNLAASHCPAGGGGSGEGGAGCWGKSLNAPEPQFSRL